MNSTQKVIHQNIMYNPIILNSYSLQNLLVPPTELSSPKKIQINMKNIISKQYKILYSPPKNKIDNKNFKEMSQENNSNKENSPIPSRKLKENDYNNLKTYNGQKPNSKLFPRIIDLTTISSIEKTPRDSEKKSKILKKYPSKIDLSLKIGLKNSSSLGSFPNKFKKAQSPKVNSVKYLKLNNDNNNNKNPAKSNKFPKDSKPEKIPDYPSKLNLKEFIFDKQIGKGTYGNIYSVKWKKNNKYYSLKKEILTDVYIVQQRKKVYKIIQDFIKKCGSKGVIHPFCNLCYKIKVKKNVKNEQNLIINKEYFKYEYYELMEKADKDWEKEICKRRENDNYYTQNELINIIFQLVTALSSLQKNHITHRDIKPQNILIINGRYKLCDFGEVRELEKNGVIVQRVRGSELYMSKILFSALHNNLVLVKHNTYKSDVFSLGMCLFYAASLTYGSVDSIRELNDMNEIKNILFNYLGTRYSEKLIRFILLMLEVDENKRPNFIQLEKILNLYLSNQK